MLDHDSIEVTALKRIDRDALLLVAWGELSYAEVAEVLAVIPSSAQTRACTSCSSRSPAGASRPAQP